MMVPTLGRPILATPSHVFIPMYKLGATPCLHRLRQCLLRHRLLPYICLNRVADFVFVLASGKPEYAFILDVRLVLAKLGLHLILDGSDCIVFSIDIPL
jgi:hypothetical protein